MDARISVIQLESINLGKSFKVNCTNETIFKETMYLTFSGIESNGFSIKLVLLEPHNYPKKRIALFGRANVIVSLRERFGGLILF